MAALPLRPSIDGLVTLLPRHSMVELALATLLQGHSTAVLAGLVSTFLGLDMIWLPPDLVFACHPWLSLCEGTWVYVGRLLLRLANSDVILLLELWHIAFLITLWRYSYQNGGHTGDRSIARPVPTTTTTISGLFVSGQVPVLASRPH